MDRLIEELKNLPEVKLRLIDLTWQLIRESGGLDVDKVVSMSREIEDAAEEAKAYAEGTRVAVSCLRNLALS